MLGGRKGFTLIEVLVVTALIAVVAIAISAAFLQGNRIFESLREVKVREDVAFFIEKFTRDVKNGLDYTLSPAIFKERKISLATLSANHPKSQGPLGAALLEVTYRYDLNKREVLREERLPFSHKNNSGAKEEVVLTGIERLKFTVSHDPENPDERLPRKIGLKITYAEDGNQKIITKDILLPGAYEIL